MDMVRLEAIITKKAFTVGADITVFDALLEMKERQISSVIVLEGTKPYGIFTERDGLKIIAAKKEKETIIEEIMSKKVVCVNASSYLHDAYIFMEQKGLRHIVVVDDEGDFLDVISEGDFLRHIGFEEVSKFKSIESAMSEYILTVEETATISEVAERMSDSRCDYAVVMRGSRPLGIVSERDVNYHYVTTMRVNDSITILLGSSSLQIVRKDISLVEASAMMKAHGIHQLLVEDECGKPIGLLSRHDILKAIHGSYFELLINTIESKNAHEESLVKNQLLLEESRVLLKSVINTMPDMIWLRDAEGKFIICNSRFEEFYGAKEEQIVGRGDELLRGKKRAETFLDNDQKAIVAKRATLHEEQLVFADGAQGYFDITRMPLQGAKDEFIGVLGVARDVSERKNRELELEKLANYDILTNLPNRFLFSTYLNKVLSKSKRNGRIFAVILFDLDRFKDVNDSYGHTVGDELLVKLKDRFAKRLREGDLLARLGGDEFGVILEDIGFEEDVARVTKEIQESISLPCVLSNGVELHIQSSAGIAIAPRDGESSEELLQHADSALYEAKNSAKGMYRYYSDEMTLHAREKIAYETKLRSAVDNGELELYYQPQVHIKTGKIVGAEALLRWNKPDEGVVSPLIFIPIAEESGLINTIGEWVIRECCRQGRTWLDKGHRITLALNVSANQVKFQDLPGVITDALLESGYSANRLEIEITESALMQREEESVAMLHSLRAKGIRLAIDDFGTGYSSLSYLKRFPIDVLKIDKSFIDDIPYEKDDMAIVVAIIEMGKALGYQVLAEGVEQEEQLAFLREKGCSMYQGYYKSKPLRAADFEALLDAQK
ncbi:MAG: EAL domain-containing protein [Epsilonproteobacteria bacterium]|nr:EAL domain-containing protein [Campylobacterota bacterium]